MKTQYVERGEGRVATGALLVVSNDAPVPQQPVDTVLFADTPFKVPDKRALQVVSAKVSP